MDKWKLDLKVAKLVKWTRPVEHRKHRKHDHYGVTVHYVDGGQFRRVYANKKKATRFKARQRRSPVVKSVRIHKF